MLFASVIAASVKPALARRVLSEPAVTAGA
jgi:hypothetical protein